MKTYLADLERAGRLAMAGGILGVSLLIFGCGEAPPPSEPRTTPAENDPPPPPPPKGDPQS